MRNFKSRLSKLEKRIKPKKQLVRIYWADGTFIGEQWVKLQCLWGKMMFMIMFSTLPVSLEAKINESINFIIG